MTYDASSHKDIRRAAKAAKDRENERKGVVFNLMATPTGRNYIHDWLVRCHIFATTFNGSALGSAFAEGERNIGLQLYSDIVNWAPDQYIQMIREANDRHISSSGRSGDTEDTGGESEPGANGDDSTTDSVYEY